MEMAGITLGDAGLAGLFSLCTDCFDLVQCNPSLGNEYTLLATRVGNQRLRFRAWGLACGLAEASGHDCGLDEPDLRARVTKSMQSIVHLFVDSKKLTKRCQPKLKESQIVLSTRGPSDQVFRESMYDFLYRISRTKKRACFLAAAWRAIQDKRKFTNLVNHLDRFLKDLEQLTASLGVAENQQCFVEYQIESIMDIPTLERMVGARSGPTDTVSDAASLWLKTFQKTVKESQDIRVAARHHGPSTGDTFNTFPTNPQHENYPEQTPRFHSEDKVELPLSAPSMRDQNDAYIDASSFGKVLRPVREADDKQLETWVTHRSRLSSPPAARRIMREIEEFMADHEDWMSLAVDGDSPDYLIAHIEGPPSTPYSAGVFQISIEFPTDYPYRPPKCRFLTEIYHPNIDATGEIGIDILNSRWSSCLTVETVLVSIISVLSSPIFEVPLVPEITETYLRDKNQHEENARVFAHTYAKPEIALAAQAVRFGRQASG
jgi:ubiquitin-protein ligase